MAEEGRTEQASWTRRLRVPGIAWLPLFAALALFGPVRTPEALLLLASLAVFPVLSSLLPALSTPRGNLASLAIQLMLAFLLIGVTGKLNSSYYIILLFPVISAATTLGPLGTAVVTVLACAEYLSYLLWIDWKTQYIPGEQVSELILRVISLPVVGFVTQQLAEANRVRALNYQSVAEQLASANASLREAEAAVRRADRLAALGQLTAGLAHELRNPMATIRSSAEMLGRHLPAGDEVARELAGYIGSEVDRTNSLITRFLEFARPMKLRLEMEDVTRCLDRAIQQVEKHTPGLGVSIFKNYSPDVRPFLYDTELMERVFYNLILNAAQASRQRSAVTVKTREIDREVEVSVIDRGVGIQPKDLESIFNPFFTTKSDGVGLGLAIVSKIVDEHGGHILVESKPDEGSVFLVYLPARRKQE